MDVVYTAHASPEQWIFKSTFGFTPLLNRYSTPIKWLPSLRNKPSCVANLCLQTVSPIVICWALSPSQPACPEDAHRVTGTAAALTLFFHGGVCQPGAHSKLLCERSTRLIPGLPAHPWTEGQNRVVIHDLQVDSLFYQQDRSWCFLVPSLREFLLLFPFTWASRLCPWAAPASSCPQRRTWCRHK